TYLDWLEGGRKDASYDVGYMFLYFYGLERRFCAENTSKDEKQQIKEEVERLSQLFADNRSAQRYLNEFIEFAQIVTTDIESIQPVFEAMSWDLPLSVKLAIGARLDRGDKLGAEWMLSWFLCHPERNLRTPATRCRDEFLALFQVRFEKRFPEGLNVTEPRKALKVSYQAASRDLEGALTFLPSKPIPDISGLRKPVQIAQEIADEVMEELDKFSRFLGRNPEGRGSVEGHALLPAEIRSLFPSEDLESLKRWAVGIVDGGGLVSVLDAIERL